MSRAQKTYFSTYARAVRPKPLRSISRWADDERRLTSEASKLAGRWRTATNPLLQYPMDCLALNSGVDQVVMVWASQMGKTEVGLNFFGYSITESPGPMLLVVPSLADRKDFVMQRLDPMLSATPAIKSLVDTQSVRDSSSSLESKKFPGGILIMKGANAPRAIAGKPIRYLWMDETSGFPASAGVEGNPINLARVRLSTFAGVSKCLETSTPTIEGACHITAAYEATNQCRAYVPCPHCQEYQTLEWENMRWDNALTRAWYVCSHCEQRIDEEAKPEMLARHEWRPDRPEITRRVGVRANALYSPPGLGLSWLALAEEWLAAQNDAAALVVFHNTRLARAWKPQGAVEAHEIQKRAEPYRLRTIPASGAIITAGVDVQNDRLEVQFVAFIGHGLRCAVVDYVVIQGDPSLAATWEKLTDLLDAPLASEDGVVLYARLAAIDSGGHHTQDVYDYVRRSPTRRCGVIAIRGSSRGARQIIGKPSHQDINRRGAVIKNGVQLYNVGTETAKRWIYHRLSEDSDAEPADRRILFSHELGANYYEGLTSEVFDPKRNLYVVLSGRRNEPLDTFVYALAAAHHPALALNKRDRDFWVALSLDKEAPAQPAAAADLAQKAPAEHINAPVVQQTKSLFSSAWSRRL